MAERRSSIQRVSEDKVTLFQVRPAVPGTDVAARVDYLERELNRVLALISTKLNQLGEGQKKETGGSNGS